MRRKRSRSHRPRRSKAGLRMTSMMDILTVLLLFLLKSFVVDGDALTPVPGVNLPESRSDEHSGGALVVAVFGDAILLGDTMVASVASELDRDELWIDGLGSRLRSERERASELGRLREQTGLSPGRVTIQGDRDIHFAILQKVMYTCNQSGFDDIALAVIKSS